VLAQRVRLVATHRAGGRTQADSDGRRFASGEAQTRPFCSLSVDFFNMHEMKEATRRGGACVAVLITVTTLGGVANAQTLSYNPPTKQGCVTRLARLS
jgi:hypothetical protein